jgi:hypothetical protein
MKHVQVISRVRPGKAQFGPILDFVGLLNSIVALIANIMNTFGIELKEQ